MQGGQSSKSFLVDYRPRISLNSLSVNKPKNICSQLRNLLHLVCSSMRFSETITKTPTQMFPRQPRSHVRCNFGQGLKAEIHVNVIEILRKFKERFKVVEHRQLHLRGTSGWMETVLCTSTNF